jgi:hypothetical protein
MARQVEYVELILEPDLNNVFTKVLLFPHTEDKFSPLRALLP